MSGHELGGAQAASSGGRALSSPAPNTFRACQPLAARLGGRCHTRSSQSAQSWGGGGRWGRGEGVGGQRCSGRSTAPIDDRPSTAAAAATADRPPPVDRAPHRSPALHLQPPLLRPCRPPVPAPLQGAAPLALFEPLAAVELRRRSRSSQEGPAPCCTDRREGVGAGAGKARRADKRAERRSESSERATGGGQADDMRRQAAVGRRRSSAGIPTCSAAGFAKIPAKQDRWPCAAECQAWPAAEQTSWQAAAGPVRAGLAWPIAPRPMNATRCFSMVLGWL